MILAGYAVGCLSTGYYLTLLFTDKDIRTCGSGSTGAKNVGRVLGPAGFLATLLVDFLKGVAVVEAAFLLRLAPWGVLLSLLAVVAGHIWPVQLHLQGGKGITVAFGAMLVFDYRLVVGACLFFIIAFLFVRNYVVSGLIAVIVLPLVALLIGQSAQDVWGLAVLSILIIFAHRANIRAFILARSASGKMATEPEGRVE